jgi:hypothetical protein
MFCFLRTSRRHRAAGTFALARAGLLAGIGAGLAAADSARAALLVYEPFDYAPAALTGVAATGTNLAGSYTMSAVPAGFEIRSESPGLQYGNLTNVPAASGNRASQNLGTTAATASVDVDQDVLVPAGSSIFFSALLTLDDSANGNHLANITFNDDNGDFIGFGEHAVGVRTLRVSASTAATGQFIANGPDNAFSNGQTLLLIGHYLNASAVDGDLLQLVAYDTDQGIAIPQGFDMADPNAQVTIALSGLDIDLAKIASIDFTIRGAANNFIDELRIGSTYASVVPEPAGAALLLAFAAASGVCRSRR